MNFFELQQKFPTERSVIDYFINSRYGKTIKCNHCGEEKRISAHKSRPKFFQCNSCNNSFSIFKGTIFEGTKTDLRKWMYAINKLAVTGKKGVSACQIEREIGVTQKTAWRMLNRIRLAMANSENLELFRAIVEIDETYIGGKPRKKMVSKRGRGSKKVPVVGILDRESGRVFAQSMMPENGTRLSSVQLLKLINRWVHKDALHVTDQFKSYRILDRLNRDHSVVDHSREFVNSEGEHTNNVENFWSLVKRMHHGTYHKIGVKYLDKYLAAEAFRYSNRKDLDGIFDRVIHQAVLAS